MSDSVEGKNGNEKLPRLRVKKPEELFKPTKVLDAETTSRTEGASKSTKLKLTSLPKQLVIVSVKEDNYKIMIEFRDPNTFAPSTVDEAPINPAVQDKSAEIKVEDEIEFDEPSISVQSIALTDVKPRSHQTITDEFAEIKVEDELEFCDEIEMDATNTTCGIRFRQVVEKAAVNKVSTQKCEFICDICSKKVSSKAILAVHRLRHGKPNFHCTVCGVVKFTQLDLERHMKIHDINRMHFTCDICLKKFSSKSHRDEHKKRHDEKKFNCNVCGVAKFTQSEVNAHMKIHDADRGHSNIFFACDICPKKYARESHLKSHRKRHGKKNFSCTICGVAKYNQYEVNAHMKIHDTVRKPRNIYFPCDICSKNYPTKSCLRAHRLRHDKKKVDCKSCSATFFTQAEMERHMMVHNREQFKCPHCPKIYSHIRTVRNHVNSAHNVERPFPCSQCNKSYASKYHLDQHLQIHKRAFGCDQCNKSFTHRHMLTTHMAYHDKTLRKYACPQCPMRLMAKRDLIKHEKRHLSKKPHICHVCTRGFAKDSQLTDHSRIHDQI